MCDIFLRLKQECHFIAEADSFITGLFLHDFLGVFKIVTPALSNKGIGVSRGSTGIPLSLNTSTSSKKTVLNFFQILGINWYEELKIDFIYLSSQRPQRRNY